MKSDPQRVTGAETGSEALFFGDLRITKERRAHLALRLSELLRDLRKLEMLDAPEIEPAVSPTPDKER